MRAQIPREIHACCTEAKCLVVQDLECQRRLDALQHLSPKFDGFCGRMLAHYRTRLSPLPPNPFFVPPAFPRHFLVRPR